ncbi:MAG: putative (S)-2-haloacid dehalogenase [Candidatus Saccharibacteria bacterium]|nr:putative (S)-2-haloacid dehalogenase [Candidatus Saccharibacteria bacterium]
MIRALIFDCFGVLYRDNIDMLYELVPFDKRQAVHDVIHACDHGFISRSEYFDAIAELSGKTSDDIRELDKQQHSRNEQLIAYAKELKKDYKIGLLSNIGDETMDQLFPVEERTQLFDAFILSSQVGIIKPAREIFELAAHELGVASEECVMIDDLAKNVEGARMAGMQALLFTNNRQFQSDLQIILEQDGA